MLMLALTPEKAGGEFPTLQRFHELFNGPYYQNDHDPHVAHRIFTMLLKPDHGVIQSRS